MTPFEHESLKTDREAGFALVAVLWFLVLVAAVAAPFAVAARTDFLIASNRLSKVKLDMRAEALSTLLSLRLTDRDGLAALGELPLNSSPVSCAFGDYTFLVRVQSQSGLIDLNAADRDLLAVGLSAVGLSDAAGDKVADTIVDYRNSALQTTPSRPDVEVEAGLKSGPFESVVELAEFEPLKEAEPARLRKAFTVHSGQGTILASQAPKELTGRMKGYSGAPTGDIGGYAQAFAVEVTVSRRRTGVRGYAGFVIQPSDRPTLRFRRVEQLFEPSLLPNLSQPDQPCPTALRNDIAQLMGVGE